MATSPIYSWPEPDNTDLVKNGALAMRTLGDAIDTTMATMVPKTIVDAKGDIIAATAADTVARLAVGTDGQTLVADSSTATGLKWATAAGGGGKVLQVVYASTTTRTINSTNTLADTTLTATITPTLATSKVLVLVNQNGLRKSGGNSANAIVIQVFRGATGIGTPSVFLGYTGDTTDMYFGTSSASILDTPATTSATTYKTRFRNDTNAAQVEVQSNSDLSTMILMEIGA